MTKKKDNFMMNQERSLIFINGYPSDKLYAVGGTVLKELRLAYNKEDQTLCTEDGKEVCDY